MLAIMSQVITIKSVKVFENEEFANVSLTLTQTVKGFRLNHDTNAMEEADVDTISISRSALTRQLCDCNDDIALFRATRERFSLVQSLLSIVSLKQLEKKSTTKFSNVIATSRLSLVSHSVNVQFVLSMLLVNFNVLRRVGFGLLSVLLLCSSTLEITRVVRTTSLPLGSTFKRAGSALKKASLARPQKSKS